MALTLIPKQIYSGDPADRNTAIKLKANSLPVLDNNDFAQGPDGWTLVNGLSTGPVFPATGHAPFITDGGNVFRIRQTASLGPGNYVVFARFNWGNIPVSANLIAGALGSVALPTTPGQYIGGSLSFTVPSSMDVDITLEATFGVLSPVLLGSIVIYDADDADVDKIALQVEATGKGSNLLAVSEYTIPTRLTATPTINAFDGNPKSWNDLGVANNWSRFTLACLDAGQTISINGRYCFDVEITDFTLTSCRCDKDATFTELEDQSVNAEFDIPSFGVGVFLETCIGPEQDGGPPDWVSQAYADLELGDYVDYGFYGTAEWSGTQYDLVLDWEDVRVKVFPMYYRENIVLNSGYHRLKFKIRGVDKITVIIRSGSNGPVVYQEESKLNDFDAVINIPSTTNYEILLQWETMPTDDTWEIYELSLLRLEEPRVDLVANSDNVAMLFDIEPFRASESAIVGDSYGIAHTFFITVLGVPLNCYYIKIYDSEGSEVIETNTIDLRNGGLEDYLKIEYVSAGYVKSGHSLFNYKDFPSFLPNFRIRAIIYNPFNTEARESQVFRTGFIDSTYVNQRTIRILQTYDHLPEFILLALFFAFMQDQVTINGDLYQKIDEDDLAPSWIQRVRRAPVRIAIHKTGEHYIKDNAGERLSMDLT